MPPGTPPPGSPPPGGPNIAPESNREEGLARCPCRPPACGLAAVEKPPSDNPVIAGMAGLGIGGSSAGGCSASAGPSERGLGWSGAETELRRFGSTAVVGGFRF